MLMLCLGIACIRVYFPIGFTRASIRDNVYCTLFFILRLPVATEMNMQSKCQETIKTNISTFPLILSFLWKITIVWKMLMSLVIKRKLRITVSLF